MVNSDRWHFKWKILRKPKITLWYNILFVIKEYLIILYAYYGWLFLFVLYKSMPNLIKQYMQYS